MSFLKLCCVKATGDLFTAMLPYLALHAQLIAGLIDDAENEQDSIQRYSLSVAVSMNNGYKKKWVKIDQFDMVI